MDKRSSYARTRERLEEIVTQVRAKDMPLEKSLDLYEEALRLGSACAEMIDRTDFSAEEIRAAEAGSFDAAEAGVEDVTAKAGGGEGDEDGEGDRRAEGDSAEDADGFDADDAAADFDDDEDLDTDLDTSDDEANGLGERG